MTARTRSRTVTRATHQRALRALRREMDALRADMASESQKRARAAYWSGYEDAEDEPHTTFAGRSIRRGYRSMRVSIRDETSTSQEAAIERSYRQYASNPLAWAIYNLRADYVWSDSPTVTADDKQVQEVIDKHWHDDVNDWEGKGHQRVRDLSMYGELVLEAFVRYDGILGDGAVTLGAIDAAEIAQIITDPDNRDDIVAIRLKGIAGEEHNRGRILKVIRTDPETGRLVGVKRSTFVAARQYEAGEVIGQRWRVTEANQSSDQFASGWGNVRVAKCCYGKAWKVSEASAGIMAQDTTGEMVNGQPYDGQCFYIAVNRTSIGMRGRPDGLAEIDWLDRLDQMFFDFLEHAALLKDFVWDHTVKTPDEKVVIQQSQKLLASMRSGGLYSHNENESLEPKNPDLKSGDWDTLYNTVMNFIAAGARIPVYMLGSGGDANLATATAQGSPTYRGFLTRQGIVKRMLTRILQYVIDCAVEAGELDEWIEVIDENGEPKVDKRGRPIRKQARNAFTVQMPEISPKDTAAAATVFSAVSAAVSGLYVSKLVPLQTAVEIIARAAELLGVEIDIDKVVEALQAAGVPDTSGLADALDSVMPSLAAIHGGNGNTGNMALSDDISALLAAMNEGARDKPKEDGAA